MDQTQVIFSAFSVIMIACLLAAAIFNQPLIAGLPAGLLLLFVTIADFKKIWLLLLFLMPFSVEVSLPGGFGTDLPNEPLMVLLTPVYLLYLINQGHRLKGDFIRHPIAILVLLHLGWIIVTTITSGNFIVSLKWTLAKTWYIIPFFFMTGSFVKNNEDYKKIVWLVFLPLLFTVLLTIARHAALGFSFEGVNYVMKPFFRNHVNYASILVIFFPLIWFLRKNYKRFSFKWWFIVGSLLVFLLAVQLSFTRAAYVCLVLSVGAYFIIHFRLMRYAVGATLIGAIVGLAFFINNNTFMDYSPEFKKTITHTKFNNLIEATAKGEDISTMERVYRWLGGYYMTLERPVTGFGPGNFYNFYKGYTVTAFQTYVSDNEDKSTVHCYYLLMMAEQGIPGGLIFLALVLLVVLLGEKIYHETVKPERRYMIMAALLAFITIAALNLINDLLEADKVGPFFFMVMALLINADLANRREKGLEQ